MIETWSTGLTQDLIAEGTGKSLEYRMEQGAGKYAKAAGCNLEIRRAEKIVLL
ncbi:MAG: hypothetical protein PHP80_10100 [Synergistaceae bacterium]|uniref:hypothetical protein n=1 Tax=Aminivibrio sp. TaxID=1872489 RepID=UPI00345F0349|nr:hypothetical protein [Synergistaceae bacterium]